MPGGTRNQLGNEMFGQMLYLPAVTVPNLPANSTVTQTVAVPGVLAADLIAWNQQSSVAGISVENIFVSATGVLTFLWSNTTASAINSTPAQPFLLEVTRPENSSAGVASLPSSLA